MGVFHFGVVIFPGSNCDYDAYHVVRYVLGQTADFVWHQDTDLTGLDVLILPGGFSYGDYLRTGAMARFSPVVRAIPDWVARGGIVLGICNGFQILLEAGLLPGAMLPNRGLAFICDDVYIKPLRYDTPFTCAIPPGRVLRVPIAHYEGQYFAPARTLRRSRRNGQVVFQYCDSAGRVRPSANPNGSRGAIAGLMDETGRILGMMPHPERASEAVLGSTDGRWVFESIVTYLERRAAARAVA